MNEYYKEYYTPDRFFRRNTAYQQFKDKFDFGLELFNESEKLKEIISKVKMFTDEQEAVSLIFLKSQPFHISTLKLCNEGIRESAGALLRSLYENYISIQYIIKNNQGERFLKYKIASAKAFFDIYERHFPDSEKTKDPKYLEFRESLSELFKRVEHLYTGRNGRIRLLWSDKSFRDMAIDVGKEKSYDYIFRLYSAFVHCSIDSMSEYQSERSDGSLIFDNSSSLNKIDEILDLTSTYFGMITTEWVGIYGVEIPEIFQRYLKKNTE